MTRNVTDDAWLLSVPEAARALGIGDDLAWKLIGAGDIPSVRLGRYVKVPRGSLASAIKRLEGQNDGKHHQSQNRKR